MVKNRKANISSQKKKKKIFFSTVINMMKKENRVGMTCLGSGAEGGVLPELSFELRPGRRTKVVP